MKSSGKPRIPYNHAVEEALCYGWIDSTVRRMEDERFAQRFTPRSPRSNLSQMNKERVRRLIKKKLMTPSGLKAIRKSFNESDRVERSVISPDILKALKRDQKTWENFSNFPESYKRIRISWIEEARSRPETFKTRLRYFLRMTAKNKKYGMVQ